MTTPWLLTIYTLPLTVPAAVRASFKEAATSLIGQRVVEGISPIWADLNGDSQ